MRLPLDEFVPRPLKYDLSGHDAEHVVDMRWSAKRNGPTGVVKLAFIREFTRFENLAGGGG